MEDVPPFATYTSLDALGQLFALRPDPLASPKGEADWSTAWRFLMEDTHLALDDPSEAVYERLLAGDVLARALVDGGLGHAYAADMRRPAERWRMHLGSTRPSAGTLSAEPEAAASLVTRALRPDGVALRQGERVPEAMADFQLPTPGFVLVDPYALSSGRKGLEDGVAALLAALIPPSQVAPVEVLLVCGSVAREGPAVVEGPCPYLTRHFGGDVRAAEHALGTSLARRRPRPRFRVSVVADGMGLYREAYHDRHVFSQYLRLNVGRSVDKLVRGGVVAYSTSVDAWSALRPASRPDTLFWLEKVRRVVTSAPDSLVSGSRDHPLFRLLEA